MFISFCNRVNKGNRFQWPIQINTKSWSFWYCWSVSRSVFLLIHLNIHSCVFHHKHTMTKSLWWCFNSKVANAWMRSSSRGVATSVGRVVTRHQLLNWHSFDDEVIAGLTQFQDEVIEETSKIFVYTVSSKIWKYIT